MIQIEGENILFFILLLLFIVIPAIEIAIFIWTGSNIGVWSVLGLILLTGLLGTLIVRHEGLETLRSAQRSMELHKLPTDEIIDGICIIFGAVLLISPGFLTDTIGFLIVFPLTRKPFRKMLQYFIRKKIDDGTIFFHRW